MSQMSLLSFSFISEFSKLRLQRIAYSFALSGSGAGLVPENNGFIIEIERTNYSNYYSGSKSSRSDVL
ncbi:hypothetical protein [Flavobacterium piscisymbiosum]|uniref:Uncharacterized protein n=1 Tax=Flavobacterium piscisymbiosum TaxID=2893753 RepID=A0ABS8MIG8_9FLAO|nr:hypothetical protein [Flavobacterium sp. F-30]MCC9064672.1 hypothetical protein [Flavobacterium sp. F-30]